MDDQETQPPTVETPTPHGKRNPTGRNQWTKLAEARARGIGTADLAEQGWRERYKASGFVHVLAQHVAGKAKLKPTQIKAAEILLDRLEPRLSAVEQTQHDPDARKTPEQLLEELKPLLLAHPEYLRALGFVPLEPVKEAATSADATEAAQQQVIVSASGKVSG